MPDFERRRNRRFVLNCERCGRRIAWTTFVRALRFAAADPFLAGESLRPWQWQGKGTPIRYYREGSEVFVDVDCRACGHRATYPADDIPLLVAR